MVNKLFVLCLCLSAACAQFGESNRRENRHFLSNLANRVSAVLHLQPYNPGMVFHPFSQRPISSPSQYDEYGRPVVFPSPNQTSILVSQGRNPDRKPYGSNVKFPDQSGGGDPPQWASEVANDNSEGSQTLPALSPVGTESQPVFTSAPTLSPLISLPPSASEGSAYSVPPENALPELTPVPTSESRNSVDPDAVHFSDPCEVDGVSGICVPISACNQYYQLLRTAQNNPQVVQLLRKVHCGFEGSDPKVCCPGASIPTQPPSNADLYSPPPTTTVAPTAAPTPAPDSDYITHWPEPPECGVSNATFTRVVGGVDAQLGDFPWMALLGYKQRRSTQWNCGGSLFTSKHVLTAAHCINGHEKTLYVVRLGEHDLSRADEGATPVDVLIKKVIKHERFNSTTIVNDIGLLVLEKPVQFTDMIRPICIPFTSELRANTFENYNPLIAGWGNLEYNGESASVLQVLQLPVVSNPACREAFIRYKQLSIDERVICAGFKKGGKDACQGDSGGPLMQPIWNSQTYKTYFYQIGVVSFGKKCAEPGFPGVYTRVTEFIPWLQQQIFQTSA